MQQRFLYGFIAVGALLCLIMLDALLVNVWPGSSPHRMFDSIWEPLSRLVMRGSAIPLLFVGLVIVGWRELMRLLQAAGLRPHAHLSLILALILMISPWLCSAGILGTSPVHVEAVQWQLVWLIVMFLATTTAQLLRGASQEAIADLAATWLVVLYLGFFPAFAIMLRCSANVSGDSAAWLVLFFLLITKSSDIGAYLFGSWLGRHKLLPSVSPAKSVEGAIGGVVASMIVAAFLYKLHFLVSCIAPVDSDYVTGLDDVTRVFRFLTWPQVIVFGALMSVSGQIGDLLESVLKRAAHQKDSAQILPGYGGVLDLIDSPIMAAPVAWVVLTVFWDVV